MSHRSNPLHRAMTFIVMADSDPEKEWPEALINAAIMAGVAFFSTLASLGATGLLADPLKGLLSAGIAAGLTFFSRLAVERGLPAPEGTPEGEGGG